MLRLFVEGIARIEAALLVALCVTLVGVGVSLVFWLRARKSNSQNSGGS